MFDHLIVGAGFAGSVLAERLAAGSGKRVLICDRRPHIGGNAYDCYDDAGLLVHKYGPHIFHTNSQHVFEYLSRFTAWRPYEHRVLASVDGQLVPIPINLDTVNRLYGLALTSFELDAFFQRVAEKVEQVPDLRGRRRQQGGPRAVREVLPRLHPQAVGARSERARRVRHSAGPDADEPRRQLLHRHVQAMPLHGYTRMFERMLGHERIKVMINTDYRESRGRHPLPGDDLHRADRRVLRLPVRQAAVSITGVPTRDARRAARAGGRHGELPERARVHADHRVQAPDRAGARQDQHRLRVPARGGRSVLPGAAPGERGAVREVPRAGQGDARASTSWAGSRPTATTTWTRSSRRRSSCTPT